MSKPKLKSNAKVVNTVYSTNDHNIFSLDPANRDVRQEKVKELEESIAKYGLLQPILVNSRFVVIEGQHRLAACRNMGRPIEYIVKPDVGTSHIVVINTKRSNTTLADWLKFHQDKQAYQLYSQLLRESRFSITTLYIFLKGREMAGKDKIDFLEGRMEVAPEELEQYHNNLGRLTDILETNEGQYKKKLSAHRAMHGIVALLNTPGYDHKHFISRLREIPAYEVKSVHSGADAKLMIENIYNWKLAKRNRITL